MKTEREVREELEALKKSYPKILHIKSEAFFQEGMIKALCWVLGEDYHQTMREILSKTRFKEMRREW